MIPTPEVWTPGDWAVFDTWAGGASRCIGRIRNGRRCQTPVPTPGSNCRRHRDQPAADHHPFEGHHDDLWAVDLTHLDHQEQP